MSARSVNRRGRRHRAFAAAPAGNLLQKSLPLALLGAAFVVLAAGGGSNRTDVISLIYVRPALVLILSAMLLVAPVARLRELRWPLGFLLSGAVLAIIQLIPLPPALWTALPGRALILEAAEAQGVLQPWRPISMTPDLTIQSLLWFLAPACALVGWAAVPKDSQRVVLWLVLGLGLSSALLGGLQSVQGVQSPLHLYKIVHEGNAIGFFANRNHQGALLAAMFPLLRAVTLFPANTGQASPQRLIAAGACALMLIPLILLTGSRAALALAVVGMLMAGLIAPGGRGRRGRLMLWSMLVASAALGTIVFFFGRALSIDRLFALNALDDLRLRNMPQVLHMIWGFFPFGSGLGSFDPVFRIFEPDVLLRPTTFNHAHNDYFEIAITGGLAGCVLMAAGLLWWMKAGLSLFGVHTQTALAGLYGRAGWGIILILLLASTVDYPLRTPLLGFIFTLAAAWIAQALREGGELSAALQESEAEIGRASVGRTYEELNP